MYFENTANILSRVKTGGVVCGDDKNSVKGGGSSEARDKMRSG